MKRLLSLVLCALLLVSLVVPVYAETDPTETTAATDASTEAETEAASEESTETATEDATEDETEEATEESTEEATEESTEAATEQTTETTEESTESAEETSEATEEYVYVEPEVIPISVNYSNAAPFLPAVEGATANVFTARRLLAAAPSSTDSETELKDNSGVVTSKTVKDNSDGTYTITLESYVTGSTTTTTESVDIPTDIILILDQSGSMKDSFGSTYTAVYNVSSGNSGGNGGGKKTYYVIVDGSYVSVTYCNKCHAWTSGCEGGNGDNHTAGKPYTPMTSATDTTSGHVQFYSRTDNATSKLDALKSAVTTFVNNVNAKAKGADGIYGTEDDIQHRIAVVGFASANIDNPYQNTELFIGASQYGYTSASGQFSNAFQDMNTLAGYNNVIASKNALESEGGTYVDLGIEMANGIFEANSIPSGEKRNRVVIIFTDGAPGYNGSYKGNNYGNSGDAGAVQEVALTKIATTKNTYGATVYTVGIFEGADATSAGNNSGNDTQRANYFMQRLSSNTAYPQTPSYYLSAADAGTLSTIFQQISNNIQSGGASVTLGTSTVVKDIISDYFELPDNAEASDIKVYTADYTGENTFDDPKEFWDAEVSIDGKEVTVTNFNFSENWCGTDKNSDGTVTSYHGKKLIIEIPIVPEPDFLGGDAVITNGAASGIYENSTSTEAVENFQHPTVNVDVKTITPVSQNLNIYLGTQASLPTVSNLGKFEVNGTEYQIDGINNAYVNIVYTIKDSQGSVLGTYTVEAGATELVNTGWSEDAITHPFLYDDASYSITCEVISTNNQENIASCQPVEAKVDVFKPVVTFRDSEINLGESADYSNNGGEIEKWLHGDVIASDVTMNTEEPTLSYNYTPTAGAFTSDQEVQVSVTINGVDVTKHITFYRDVCNINGCEHTTKGVVATTGETWVNFVVHISTFDLTITKKIDGENDPNQIFVFHVVGEKASMDVVIYGEGSVKVTNLPVGTYTITEDQSWSWRYTANDPVQTVSSTDVQNGVANITFTNIPSSNKWLTDTSVVSNNFTNTTTSITD